MKRLSRPEVLAAACVIAALALVLGAVIAAGEWQDYWTQFVVGDVLPPSFWTLLGITIAYVRMHRHVTAQHEATAAHVDRELAGHLKATTAAVAAHARVLGDQVAEQHAVVMKHLGKQSAHLVKQDNVMRDMKGTAKP